ncbi:MAG: tautomerase [Gammaproteobacteria bacterium]|nr:MAG: tautomerase [Gammaproteobacteria bacterium]
MPHLQFDINRPLSDEEKQGFAEAVRALFSRVMDTGTDHIAVSIRQFGTHDLSLGRVTRPEQGVALVNADIREGRSLEQRRALALGLIELLDRTIGIPPAHVYVTCTEHKGEDFHLAERYLAPWNRGEDPLA